MNYLKTTSSGTRPVGTPDAGQILCMPFPLSQYISTSDCSRFVSATDQNLAFRAVNQSIGTLRSPVGLDRCLDRMLTVTVACTGRAIRNSQDWAAIILLDARYTQQSKKSQLPKWLGSNVQSPATFGGLLQGLVAFNKARRKG